MGTSNNICRALNLSGPPLEIVARLANPIPCRVDLGRVAFPWGTEYFLEAMGFGFFADALAAYHPELGKSVARSLSTLIETLRSFQPHPCQISLDGRDVSGAYILVEVMNMPLVGPGIRLAPDARLSDGLLDVVRIRAEVRQNWLEYIAGLLDGNLETLPNVDADRGRRLDLLWEGWYPIHLDGEVRPPGFEIDPAVPASHRLAPRPLKASEAMLSVDVLPGALELWLPRKEG